MMQAKINKAVKRYRMLERGECVVVAVSGGPDSVCLLHALLSLAPAYDLRLHVAHLDHRFRGEGSAADAKFVAGLAGRFHLPATIEAIDVPAYCRQRGLSPQAGAREVRYAFLERVASGLGAQRIAVGHTANDQAETLLMRLLRGAGLTAMAAIPPVRGKIIRPLLDVTRTEVLDRLRDANLDFATDPSNEKPVYTRNRIRMHVIPELEKINPRAVEALAAGAGLLRDEAAVADAQCEPVLAGVLTSDGGTVRIDRERFLALLPALRRRALRKAAASLGGDLHRFSLIHTEEATSFMEEAQTGRAMELPGGLILERSYGEFVVRPGAELPPFSAALPVPGATLISEVFLSVTAEVDDLPRGQEEKGNYLWQAEFDYAKIALPLLVRNRRDGDRLCPAGMGGRSKKLQDLFVDEKVPFSRRSSIPVLATEHDILWVMGMRTDERFLPGPDTKKVLRVTVTEEPVRGTK